MRSAGDELDDDSGVPERDGTIRSGKLAGRSMPSAIWVLAMPVLLQQTMAAAVGMIDKIIAGSLTGDVVVPALDGLGVGSYVGWFIGIAMTGLGVGGQALIARAMGGGRPGEAESAAGQAIILSVAWGLLVGVFMWIAAPGLASMCGLEGDAARYCIEYVRVLAVAMPLFGLMHVGSMCLYGAGEMAWPAAIGVVVNIVNVIVSWLLSGAVVRIGDLTLVTPLPVALDVLGIALGSAVGFTVGAVLTLIVLVRGVKDLRLKRAALSPQRSMSRRIIRVGVPNFFEGISMWAANLFVLLLIGALAADGGGEGLQGAHIIAVQWESFAFLPGFAIGTAAGTLAGQYIGAGSPALAQRAVLTCTGIAVVIMGGLGMVFIFAGETLTSLISREAVHLEHAPKLLVIGGTIQVAFAIAMVIRQGLRGVGDTRWTFLITTVSSYGLRLPAAWFFGIHLGWGLQGIWIGLCGELVIRAALFAWRFFHGGWKELVI